MEGWREGGRDELRVNEGNTLYEDWNLKNERLNKSARITVKERKTEKDWKKWIKKKWMNEWKNNRTKEV